jgi:dTDP-4-dehydrorhamnose 3,5-epimerase
VIYYKCSQYRNKNTEETILWNDPDLKINWPTAKPILSKKDKKGIFLKKFKN